MENDKEAYHQSFFFANIYIYIYILIGKVERKSN